MISKDKMIEDLQKRLSVKRLEHSLKVAETAVELAERWGVDTETCKIAGLVHDCGKMGREKEAEGCIFYKVILDEEDEKCPQVIHANLSEAIACHEYGIKDEEILKAVRHHTLGDSNMGVVEKIIFVADMTKPGRIGDVFETIRRKSFENLDEAVLEAYRHTVKYNKEKGRYIHAKTIYNKKIMEGKCMTPKEKVERVVELMSDKKAIDVEQIDVSTVTIIADYFVICSGTSSTHVKGIADEIEFKLKETGILPLRIEGYNTANWILMDYGDIIVHVFYEEDRKYYNLERLWKAAK